MGIRSQNNPLAAYLDVFSNTGTDAAGEPVLESGLTASGGFVNDYTEGGIVYRAHIFTTNSQFQVTALGDYDNTVQYLVVGGGGGGGNDGGEVLESKIKSPSNAITQRGSILLLYQITPFMSVKVVVVVIIILLATLDKMVSPLALVQQ